MWKLNSILVNIQWVKEIKRKKFVLKHKWRKQHIKTYGMEQKTVLRRKFINNKYLH